MARFSERVSWRENGRGPTSDQVGIPGNLATFTPARNAHYILISLNLKKPFSMLYFVRPGLQVRAR